MNNENGIKCKQSIGAVVVENYDYGVVDSKGRRIGSIVRTAMITYEPAPDASTYYRHAPGTWFGLNTSATRGGKSFGAWTPYREFSTAGDRAAAFATFLRGAERRARKEAARGCKGHPASSAGTMGETVYCDGACRTVHAAAFGGAS